MSKTFPQSTIPDRSSKEVEEEGLLETPTVDGDLEGHLHLAQLKGHKRQGWTIVILSLLCGAIVASLPWLILPKTTKHPQAPHRHCGQSPSEARSLDCEFQLWSYSWVPDPCFDSGLQDEYLELHSAREKWGYFTKVNGTEEDKVPLDEVLAGDRNDLFSTWGQHYWHCAFYQRKFFRMLDGGEATDVGLEMMTNRDKDEHHAHHCQDWLADPFKYEWSKVNINLTLGYHTC